MSIRIAIPEPTSTDLEYNGRSLPHNIAAMQSSGATPNNIPLQAAQDTVAKQLANTHGELLPGSGFDVDPERYGEPRIPECGPADPARTAVDELLLQDAFNLRKPVLAICHGLQTLNVWLNGSLIQDIPAVLRSPVNHNPGRDVVDAHAIAIQEGSILAQLALQNGGGASEQVNSSHHQAIAKLGDRLRVSALSPQEGVVEAVEGNPSDLFVLGVQWHPERTFFDKQFSREIFGSFVRAAEPGSPPHSSS